MSNWLLVLPALAIVVAGVAHPTQAAVEEPNYTLVREDGDFEIRDYPTLLVAETTEAGDRRDVSNTAFRRLASYIFEEDRPEGEIEMTAPVLMAPQGSEETYMQFVMPERFDMQTLPTPEDARVKLQETPARRVAAIRFSGWAGDDDLAEKEAELRTWITSQGLEPVGQAEWAFYNPPWTLGPWRRNEVLIEVSAQ
ncbi:MAG: heme-binding protein [Neomegalonema sp.]